MQLPTQKLVGHLKKSGRNLLDLVYPTRCAACGVRLGPKASADFCDPCSSQLEPVVPPACGICSEPFPGDIPGSFVCPNCAGQKFAFDFAVSAWHASGPLREAVHRFKYGGLIHLRLPLARRLLDALGDSRLAPDAEIPGSGMGSPSPGASAWVIVPVPLHARRFRERKFNQSAELALTLAKLSGLPCQELLRRTRYTTSQAALNRKERLKNLAGAFAIRPGRRTPCPPDILLVDDVFTTGSTAHECAAVLKSAGARRIVVLTVARG